MNTTFLTPKQEQKRKGQSHPSIDKKINFCSSTNEKAQEQAPCVPTQLPTSKMMSITCQNNVTRPTSPGVITQKKSKPAKSGITLTWKHPKKHFLKVPLNYS